MEACDHITDEVQSDISIEYIVCHAKKEGIKLPKACQQCSSFWSECDGTLSGDGLKKCCTALHNETTNLWTTHAIFYHGINFVCSTYMDESLKQWIQLHVHKLSQMGWDNTNDIHSMMREFNTLRVEHAVYFQLIENGIHDTTTTIAAMGENVNAICDISDKTAHKLNAILDSMNKVLSNILHIEKMPGKATSMLENIVCKLYELKKPVEKAFKILEKSNLFLTFISDKFMMAWHLWHIRPLHILSMLRAGPHSEQSPV